MFDTTILILDDEERVCEELSEFLVRKKYQVIVSAKPSTAFEILKNNPVDIVFLDLTLPEMDGIVVLEHINKLYPHIQVIMISGNKNVNIEKLASQKGVIDFISKPFRHNDVKQALKKISWRIK